MFLLMLLIRYRKISIDLPYYIFFIISFIAVIQLIQIVVISIIKVIYDLNKLLKHRKDFEVRNSL